MINLDSNRDEGESCYTNCCSSCDLFPVCYRLEPATHCRPVAQNRDVGTRKLWRGRYEYARSLRKKDMSIVQEIRG